ncbi:MAG: hypothetical protein GY810_27055 [Aureispira sp.]|nr:hypothetical protein [Aureispira sp.]
MSIQSDLKLPPSKDIIWSATPQPGFSITMLENRAQFETITWGAGMFPFVVVAVAANAILFFMNGMIWTMILVILIGIAIIVRPEFKKAERKKHTAYNVTEQGVFFKLWRDGQEVIKLVPYSIIEKVHLEVFKTGKGNISLFIKGEEPGFTTYDFGACKALFHPTLIMVDDARTLTNLLRERVKKNRK